MTDEQVRRLEERLEANSAAIAVMAKQLDRVRTEDLPELRVEIAGLKVTARIWGAVAGIVGSAIGAVILAVVIR